MTQSMSKANLFQKIKRYFNPTFAEWLGDYKRDFNKEMQDPKVAKLLIEITQSQEKTKNG